MLDGDARVDGDVLDLPANEPVGGRLRAGREAAGLSLEQVSARTRIRVPVLRDLEDDRLGSAGNAVYTRGHIRAIAAAVGIDAAPLVAAFDERVGASAPSALLVEPVAVPGTTSGPLAVPLPAKPERSQPRWLTASLAGAAVLVGLLALEAVVDERPDPQDARAVATADDEPAEPAGSADTPAVQPAPAPKPPARAALQLTAQGRSWLSVQNRGGYPLYEGMVDAGWTKTFDDPKRLTVRVGNAAAVTASCAGRPAGPPGAEGAVLTLTCTPEGLQQP